MDEECASSGNERDIRDGNDQQAPELVQGAGAGPARRVGEGQSVAALEDALMQLSTAPSLVPRSVTMRK
jgi:hypothetical protein